MALFKKSKSSEKIAFAMDNSYVGMAESLSAPSDPLLINKCAQETLEENITEPQFKVFADTHKLAKSECIHCLDMHEYRLVSLQAPEVPEEELGNALKWAVAEYIEQDLDDVVIDYFDIPKASNMGEGRQVNVVVVEKSIIEEKAKLYKSAGLKLSVVDIPDLAIRNLVTAYDLDEEGVVFLYLASKSGLIVFVKEKQLYFSRQLELGYEQLIQLRSNQQNLALELQRSLDYFYRHFSNIGIKHLVVAPPFKSVPDLTAFLDENLSISCIEFDYSTKLNWAENLQGDTINVPVLALGSVLRSEDKK